MSPGHDVDTTVQNQPPSALYDALDHRSDKQEWVDWLFSYIAPRYDLGNDIMSLGWHTRWKHRLVDMMDIQPDHRVLDLACGTGDTTWLVAQRAHQGEVVGTDINVEMMSLAEPKRPPGVENVTFMQCDAGELPFEAESFDRVTCTYAGRGFPDWPAVLREAYRVLKPGGIFCNLDFARPPVTVVDWGYRAYMMGSGAILGVVLHRNPKTYMYIPASMAHYRGQRWLDDQMREVGFETQLTETFLWLMAFNRGVKPG